MKYLIISIGSFISGFLQGCTGFGAVMIMMIIFPFFLPITDSIGIANSSTIVGNLHVFFQHRKDVIYKKVLIPSLISIIVNAFATLQSIKTNQQTVRKAFGMFLIILSLYYLIFNKGKKWNLSLPVKLIIIVAYAIFTAFFGIGGPLIAIYFMNTTKSRSEYLGSIQLFFLITGLFNTIVRISSGLIKIEHLPLIIIGMLGVFISGIVSKSFIDRIEVRQAELLTYLLVGFTGVYNLFF